MVLMAVPESNATEGKASGMLLIKKNRYSTRGVYAVGLTLLGVIVLSGCNWVNTTAVPPLNRVLEPGIHHMEFGPTGSLFGTAVDLNRRAFTFNYTIDPANLEILALNLSGYPRLVPGSSPEAFIIQQIGGTLGGVGVEYYLVSEPRQTPELLENFGWQYDESPVAFGVIPDERLFLVSKFVNRRTVYSLWDMEKKQSIDELDVRLEPTETPTNVSHTFGPDNSYILIGAPWQSRTTLRLCTIRPFRQIAEKKIDGRILRFEKCADSNEVILITSYSTVIRIKLDPDVEKPSERLKLTELSDSYVMETRDAHWVDGTVYFAIEDPSGILVADVPDGELINLRNINVEPSNAQWGFSVNSDGRQVAISDGFDTITLWDVSSEEPTKTHTFRMDLDALTMVSEER